MRRLLRPWSACTLPVFVLIGAAVAQEPPAVNPAAPASPTPSPIGALVTPSPTPRADLPGEPTTPTASDWPKAAATTEHHARLAKLVGKWNLSMSAAPPGEDASAWKGTVEYASILGGRFLTEHAIIDLGGTLFEWQGILGYDADKKKYTAVWVDNMGTDMELAEGEVDPAGGKITYDGQTRDPSGATKRFTWIVTLPELDDATIEMRMPEGDASQTVMKMALKREKKAE